ncbi:DUF5370 family protein [Bacillus marinisedimentorum]|uniref:DUF5370 family protein n=1 Tax=Bacillus marinisedimentorum TaxID=1821260 RepID=UPI0007DFA622|nr:DUF5370 family protein [Bacillus marinisedimentorum]
MGAIERNGFRFEVEYSVMQQRGAVHVTNTTDGSFVREISFSMYMQQSPTGDQIDGLIDGFLEEVDENGLYNT